MNVIINGINLQNLIYNRETIATWIHNGIIVYGPSSILIANPDGSSMLTQNTNGKNVETSVLALATDSRTIITGASLKIDKPYVKVTVTRPLKKLIIKTTVSVSGVDGNLSSSDYYYYFLYVYKNGARIASLVQYMQSSASGRNYPISYTLTGIAKGDVVELKAAYGSYSAMYRVRGLYNKILYSLFDQ